MNDQLQNKRWEKLALALEEIQSLVFKSDKNRTEDLLCHLSGLDLPFPEKSLSIVYRPYGAEHLGVLVYRGDDYRNQAAPKELSLKEEGVIDTLSKKATKAQQIRYLESTEDCQAEGLDSAHSAILCPIRLSSEKNLGVFILTSRQAGDELEGFGNILHNLSDRMAYYIRHNTRKRRNNYFVDAQYDLLNNEYKDGKVLVDKYLEKMKGWFKEDQIHILLKHPLDTNKYVLATKDNKLIKNWRGISPSSVSDLSKYLRQDKDLSELETAGEALTRNTFGSVKELGITGKYASYAAAPLQLKHKVILGYVVITNSVAEQAFEYDEDKSIDTFSDFFAQLVGTHRNDKFRNAIRAIREFELEDSQLHETKLIELYQLITDNLLELYGINELSIIRYTHSDLGLVVEYASDQIRPILEDKVVSHVNIKEMPFYRYAEDNRKKEFSSLSDAILDIITTNHKGNIPTENTTGDKPSSKSHLAPLIIHSSTGDKKYFVSPMRTKTHSAGCFIFSANNIGSYTARSIDDISDTLGLKLDGYGRWKRYSLLNRFSKEIAQLKEPTESDVLVLAQEFISSAMYTDNLYIALYDHKTKNIRFALAFKEGKPWTKEEGFNNTIHGSVRELDEAKQGKTEYLLLNAEKGLVEFLLHRTKVESENWYNQSGRQEFAGDPLASWVGVPIYSDEGVVGVIATYHDKLDYIFSERDVFFLRQIASSVSAMLQSLDLKEVNTELENAQSQIAEQQHVLSTALLAQDLTHRLNNTIGSVSINVDQAIRDIQYVRDTNDFNTFDFTTESLQEVGLILKELVKEIRNISDNSQQAIDTVSLIEKVAKQISIVNRLEEKSISIKTIFPAKTPDFVGHYRTLFNTLAALVENAAHAVLDARIRGLPDPEISIRSSYNSTSLTISVADSGTPIQPKIVPLLFQYGASSKGSSGFGLWRARNVIEKLGGSLTYENAGREKIFNIHLPLPDVSKGIAYVLDDESSWRGILNRWMTEAGYEVHTAGTAMEMRTLLSEIDVLPECVLLDISLDSKDGSNYDGLGLISLIKEQCPQAKIIVISGYPEAAQSYNDVVDAIISKVGSDGEILSREVLAKIV